MSEQKVIDVGTAPSLSLANRQAPVPMALKEYSSDELGVIRNTIARGCNDTEVVFFLTFCRNAGLDPFQKEVYAIPRGQGNKRQLTLQMSIDGLRRRAHDTGSYAGMDRPVFGPSQSKRAGNYNVTVPEWCEIVVYKMVQGQRVPFPAKCFFSEYAPQLSDTSAHKWRGSPYNQLEKCTEAKALRRAFPEQVKGLYAPEEFSHASSPVEIELPPEQAGAPIEVVKTEARVVTDDYVVEEEIEERTADQEAFEAEWRDSLDGADELKQLTNYAGVIEVDQRLTPQGRERLKSHARKLYAKMRDRDAAN